MREIDYTNQDEIIAEAVDALEASMVDSFLDIMSAWVVLTMEQRALVVANYPSLKKLLLLAGKILDYTGVQYDSDRLTGYTG